MAAATEAFVKDKIKEAEQTWRKQLQEETSHAKLEIAKMQEEIEKINTRQSSSEGWKDKRNQIDLYKEKFSLRIKEANSEKPTIKLSNENFMEFKQQVTGWMKALHPLIKKVMETLEKPENRTIDEEDIKERLVVEMREQAE